MSKKKFLLVAPRAFNLYTLIVKNVEFLGYEVTHIEDHGYDFKYRSIGQRLYNFWRKVFHGDRNYKKTLIDEYPLTKQREIIETNDHYDIAMVVRADFFAISLVRAVCERSTFSFSFHFDGLNGNCEALRYVDLFDKFYVFDEEDIRRFPESHLLYSPNFFLDYPTLLKGCNPLFGEHSDIYYVSSYDPSRLDDLIALHQYLLKYYDKIEFVLVCTDKRDEDNLPDYIKQNIEIRNSHVSFEEQLHRVAASKLIIDLVLSNHKGYSFRILEGLKFGKKVITTNSKVKEADFYHPNNFFVFKDDGVAIDDFLESPYVTPLSEVIDRYRFEGWLNSKVC